MFRKLRIKFIAVVMVSVAVVLAVAFAGICVLEYQRSLSTVRTALSGAVEEAQLPAGGPPTMWRDATADSGGAGETTTASASSTLLATASLEPQVAWADESADAGSAEDAGAAARTPGQGSFAQDGSGEGGPGEGMPEAGGPGMGDFGGFAPDGGNGADAGEAQGAGADAGADAGEDAGEASTGVLDPSLGPGQGSASNAGEGAAGNPFAGNTGTDAGAESGMGFTLSDENRFNNVPPSIGGRGDERTVQTLVPVAVYRVGDDGTLTVVPQVTSATISSDVLFEAASAATGGAAGFGMLQDLGLHYLYQECDDGSRFLAFADASYTDGWKSLALRLVLVGLGILAVFFVISLFLSKWALRPVREAWDSQRQFVADASHDLKTPLTVILANASILLKHPESTIGAESQWIESTEVEARNMQQLVNEMLELAQVEAGEAVAIPKERMDFSDLVDGQTLMFDSVALERGLSFQCEVEQGLHVVGNAQQLSKMVSTLVENAFKYVDAHGTVDVSLRAQGKQAVLAIRNTGSTISPQDLPHIFDRFYRTDKARTSDTGGFGLGLAIARGAAQQHGGDITCTSAEPVGTTFTATLPLA